MIVIDTSAFIAIIAKESEKDEFYQRISSEDACVCNAVNYQEAMQVLYSRYGQLGVDELTNFMAVKAVTVIPHDHHLAELALDAFKRFGKGRGNRAQLNFCDCAAYALAASMRAPLLFKGGDFAQTDVLPWR